MKRITSMAALASGFVLLASTALHIAAQQPAPDLLLSNGKVITVDERFSIAQAIAIKGDRIVAVGSNSELIPLAGPKTRRIDLRGRAVIPGLIDNHMQLLRAGGTWKWEVRWDGVGSRRAALHMLSSRVRTSSPGACVYNLGGWTVDQFSDDKRPFTRDELDEIAPNNPVLLQASYYETYVNSRALEALGLDGKSSPNWLVRDSSGRA